jgi:hypothetical protein
VAVVIWIILAWSLQAGIIGIVIGAFVIFHGLKRGLDRG